MEIAAGISLLASIAMAGLVIYLRGYLSEKAKGLATKEDIKDITDKVESVKSFYAKEIEALRSELSFSTQQRLAIKEKEREVLFTFLDDCLTAIHDKLNYDVTIIGYKNMHLVAEYESSVHALFAKIRMDYNRLLIYFPNESELLKAALVTAEASIETHKHFQKSFPHFAMQLVSALVYLKKYQEPELETEKPSIEGVTSMRDGAAHAALEYNRSMKPFVKTFDEAVDGFVQALKKHFEEIIVPVKPKDS